MVRAEVGGRGTGEGSTLSGCSRRRLVRRERTDVLVVAADVLHKPWYRTFFRPDQLRQFGLNFFSGTPQSVEAYVGEIVNGIIEPNYRDHPIFTSIADPLALLVLGRHRNLRSVARIERWRDGAGLVLATLPGAGYQ